MKKLILLFLPFLFSPASSFSKSYGDDKETVYVSKYDPDTIKFNIPGLHPIIGEKISIRVKGIYTPEIIGKWEQEKYSAEQALQIC